MRRPVWVTVMVSLALLVLTPVAGASPPEYEAVDLALTEPGSGFSSRASGINNRGEIVGIVWPPSPLFGEGFIWADGDVTMLGSPAGDPRTSVFPRAINNRGQIVGGFALPGSFDFTGFLYEDGGWTEIIGADAMFSSAIDINERGQVVGYDEGPFEAFIWTKGDFAYLDFADHVVPYAINNAGLAVGVYRDDWLSQQRAFVWARGLVIEIVDARGYDWSPYDVNDRGQTVGHFYESGSGVLSAFVWDDGVVTELPGITDGWSRATSINNRGQVVGYSRGEDGRSHATLWDHGTPIDLGVWGDWCLAWDINERGQVVGACADNGVERAFLWER